MALDNVFTKNPVMKMKAKEEEEEQKDESISSPFGQNDASNENVFKINVTNENDLRKENSADLQTLLKSKIDGIQEEMGKFEKNIKEYVKS